MRAMVMDSVSPRKIADEELDDTHLLTECLDQATLHVRIISFETGTLAFHPSFFHCCLVTDPVVVAAAVVALDDGLTTSSSLQQLQLLPAVGMGLKRHLCLQIPVHSHPGPHCIETVASGPNQECNMAYYLPTP
mmetsp:Transcript_25846/g.63309  ORF Transcript_25846/g.63309 Transcript_25846/m.63309 type:complete len:134 (+) Transcript_25846:133-534(+)